MATTETRSGFRLPWTGGGDAHHDDQLTPAGTDTPQPQAPTTDASTGVDAAAIRDEQTQTAAVQPAEPAQAESPVVGTPTPESSPVVPTAQGAPTHTEAVRTPTAAAPTPTEEARPNEFLAGLTRAMRSAAESEREQILSRFADEAHTFKSAIRERSDEEAEALRQRADDDVDGIHAWSERELARIRDETERRIERRRARLDEELDGSRADADHQVERVEAAVDAFGEQMTRFFERLLAEEDPARFAALAANLPVPPALESAGSGNVPPAPEPSVASELPPAPEPSADPISATPPVSDPVWSGSSASADSSTEPQPGSTGADPWRDVRMSDGAPEAHPDAVDDASRVPSTDEAMQPTTDAAIDPPSGDPRVAALGLTPDFGAAEAEAAAAAEQDPQAADGDVPAIDDGEVASRLASLTGPTDTSAGVTTRLVVVGLVSVASIAGFKRQLGRLPGVAKVGVSSGPDGEFVFTVEHTAGVDLREPVTTLPGFGARIVGVEADAIRVECHDPESNG